MNGVLLSNFSEINNSEDYFFFLQIIHRRVMYGLSFTYSANVPLWFSSATRVYMIHFFQTFSFIWLQQNEYIKYLFVSTLERNSNNMSIVFCCCLWTIIAIFYSTKICIQWISYALCSWLFFVGISWELKFHDQSKWNPFHLNSLLWFKWKQHHNAQIHPSLLSRFVIICL